MVEPHLAGELNLAARCKLLHLGDFCASCGRSQANDAVFKVATRTLKAAVVVGVVVDDADLRHVLVRAGRRVLSIHAQRGGALVVSEDRTWR
jgi:hypothetical protein